MSALQTKCQISRSVQAQRMFSLVCRTRTRQECRCNILAPYLTSSAFSRHLSAMNALLSPLLPALMSIKVSWGRGLCYLSLRPLHVASSSRHVAPCHPPPHHPHPGVSTLYLGVHVFCLCVMLYYAFTALSNKSLIY